MNAAVVMLAFLYTEKHIKFIATHMLHECNIHEQKSKDSAVSENSSYISRFMFYLYIIFKWPDLRQQYLKNTLKVIQTQGDHQTPWKWFSNDCMVDGMVAQGNIILKLQSLMVISPSVFYKALSAFCLGDIRVTIYKSCQQRRHWGPCQVSRVRGGQGACVTLRAVVQRQPWTIKRTVIWWVY